MKKSTRIIHTPYPKQDPYGALAVPVYHTLAYEFDNADVMADAFCGRTNEPDYSRITNPTVIHLENIVKGLTGARDVVAFTSGMAAISATLVTLASQGKNIVSSGHLFGNTYLLLTRTLKKFGVEARLVDLTDLDAVRQAVDADTCCIFLETVTNPQLEVADLKALSQIAHSVGAALVADSTMIPFSCYDGRSLGIDIEVVSSTKYISGGATSLGGLVIDYGTVDRFDYNMRKDTLMNLGGYMTPHAAYMQTLGLETLAARYERQQANTLEVALGLSELDGVEVNYPGLPDNRFHQICKRQFGGNYGCMLTISLPSAEACFSFINSLKMVKRATNLFDNRTLAIHPASTIFGPLTQDQRDSMDVSDRVIRLSIGLEDPDDILADLRQALGFHA